jgi:hypothetical protein
MNIFRILRESTGLSIKEAAEFLYTDEAEVRQWDGGQNPPTSIADQMFLLIDRQALAAYDILRRIHARLATRELLELIQLDLSVDDHEAQGLGWPTASAHAAVIRRVIESLPPGRRHLIRIVPHGATLASADTSAKAH